MHVQYNKYLKVENIVVNLLSTVEALSWKKMLNWIFQQYVSNVNQAYLLQYKNTLSLCAQQNYLQLKLFPTGN